MRKATRSYRVCILSKNATLLSKFAVENLPLRRTATLVPIYIPIVLYGCESRSLTLSEEHRLWMFENKIFRKIFGVRGDEIAGEWRKLHNAELHALYSSPAVGQVVACAPVTQRARVRSPVGTSFQGEVFSEFFLSCKTNVGKL